ncbi:hypothetical protein KVV02_003776 [Mortierella alpina]|uniref:Nudix hydrolase domain-containing protein n=1 Tax=Mortierella alpina TaxID=64518 RepID=A0A9P8D2Z4_MORAP|nr:hypothetical protein KVV02_003776 [Mortierella alpina]
MPFSQASLQALKNLQNHPRPIDNYEAKKRSAVLVPLLPNDRGELEVLLTVRSSTLRTNAGDSAFPGGKLDPEDVDLCATAKREAFEEVRLPPSASEVIATLSPVLSRHMQVVTPIVAYCPTLTTADLKSLYPNPGEVAAIFTAPLSTFLSPPPGDYAYFDMQWAFSNHRVHRFERCGVSNHVLGEIEESSTPQNPYVMGGNGGQGQLDRATTGWPVYGMTAGVLIEVAKIAYQREPDFEIYAPGQVMDDLAMAQWFNKTHGVRASL